MFLFLLADYVQEFPFDLQIVPNFSLDALALRIGSSNSLNRKAICGGEIS